MLKEKLQEDLRAAMKSQDKLKMATIRMVISEIMKAEIVKKADLTDPETLSILQKSVKTREESVSQFRQGEREDLAQKEEKEIEIIKAYLPKPLAPEEIESKVKEIAKELNLTCKADFGKLMKEVMTRLQGQIDGKIAKDIVTKVLT